MYHSHRDKDRMIDRLWKENMELKAEVKRLKDIINEAVKIAERSNAPAEARRSRSLQPDIGTERK